MNDDVELCGMSAIFLSLLAKPRNERLKNEINSVLDVGVRSTPPNTSDQDSGNQQSADRLV